MSWDDAVAYCKWLTEAEGKANRLPSGLVFRLPTEVEWEYACRAGTHAKFGWGDKVEDASRRMNSNGAADGFEFIAPVDSFGSRGRNKFGLADMLGNIRACMLDDYEGNSASLERTVGKSRGLAARGGAWFAGATSCRCASRVLLRNGDAGRYDGFRICCDGLR